MVNNTLDFARIKEFLQFGIEICQQTGIAFADGKGVFFVSQGFSDHSYIAALRQKHLRRFAVNDHCIKFTGGHCPHCQRRVVETLGFADIFADK